jgi:2-dehydro-3-deoxyphosphogluconate aldolase/(4S)-4-hydroxy-2-oxoglutarate aldolase
MNKFVIEQLVNARIVPVVEITDPAKALPLAYALANAGLPIMEVTLRTPAALDSIYAINNELPDFIVGAGTLLTASQVADAAAAGANFGVSPGFTPTLSKAASDANLVLVPGAVTASEILTASEHGHTYLKYFPAEKLGGAAMIESFLSPFAALGISFMPTGGIKPQNLRDYLTLSNVFAVGGTWIAPRSQIDAGEFGIIGATARDAVALADRMPTNFTTTSKKSF